MRSSKGERIIYDILKEHDINFKEEYSFPDLCSGYKRTKLRFDFAVFDDEGELDYLIEYQGQQHYTPNGKFGGMDALRRQHINDEKKIKYCNIHRIPLLIIPYTDEKLVSFDYILDKYNEAVFNLN